MSLERFWKYVRRGGNDECWPWTGPRTGKNGYGRFAVDGKGWVATRYLMTQLHGPIPKGFYVCHKCDNPPCVNPAHLWIGTQSENTSDAWNKGRIRSAEKEKTHCKRGHEFSAENTRFDSRGYRHCLPCRAMHSRNQQAKAWERQRNPSERHYTYRGDRMTDPALRGRRCSAVMREGNKCIHGRSAMLVLFEGEHTPRVVMRRQLRAALAAAHGEDR